MRYITKYKDDWPTRFETIVGFIKCFLPSCCKCHHVGSTSIPGMPAKDIIDLDIEYPHGMLEMIVSGLSEAGYNYLGDLGIAGREAFKAIPGSNAALLPEHHLYACENNAYELNKHLAYREYLLANPERAAWLRDRKIEVDASAENREQYIESKSCFYELVTKESLSWANKRLNINAAKKRGAS